VFLAKSLNADSPKNPFSAFPMKINVLKFVAQDKQFQKQTIKILKRKTINITIPQNVQVKLQDNATAMASNIEEFCNTPYKDKIFGVRALEQLSAYVKAIALRNNETIVNERHYEQLRRLFYYFNYNANPILPSQDIEICSYEPKTQSKTQLEAMPLMSKTQS